MKKIITFLGIIIPIFRILAQPVDMSYNAVGSYTFIVPTGYTANIIAQAWGAGGGIQGGSTARSGGGGGGFSTNTYTNVQPGSYAIVVGAQVPNGVGESSSYNFGTLVTAGGGGIGLAGSGGAGGVGNSSTGGVGGVRVAAMGGGGGGAAACVDGTTGANGSNATGGTGGAGGVGCTQNPGNDGTGGAGGNTGVGGSNGLQPGGGAGGKGDGSTNNSNGAAGRVIIDVVTFTALPIKLSKFSVSNNDDKAIVSWVTESEINNEVFIIEKSFDGRTFFELEKVHGAGNSYNAINYSIEDKNLNAGINYYRLKQIDYDGQYSYSDIINLNVDKRNAKYKPVNYFGNTIHLNKENEETYNINIFASNGALLKTYENFNDNNLSLANLQKGFYIAVVTSSLEGIKTLKCIVE